MNKNKSNILIKAKNVVAMVGLASSSLLFMGMYDGPQRLVEDTYLVQEGDTLQSIGEKFIEKNTGGRRHILEFTEGIRELNPDLYDINSEVHPGQTIFINYWVDSTRE